MIRQMSGCKGQKATWRAQRQAGFHLIYFMKTFYRDYKSNYDLKYIRKMRLTKTYNKSISSDLTSDIRSLIETARHNVAVTANAGLTFLYWQVGNRIRQNILKEKRAEYGKEIVATLSQGLTIEYGRGFSRRNLFNMIRFAEVFSDMKIVHALSAQLTWTHFREIIYLDDSLQRDFYAEMCRVGRWSVRTLRKKLMECFMSTPPYQRNLRNWSRRRYPLCGRKIRYHLILFSAIHKKISRMRRPKLPVKRLLQEPYIILMLKEKPTLK